VVAVTAAAMVAGLKKETVVAATVTAVVAASMQETGSAGEISRYPVAG